MGWATKQFISSRADETETKYEWSGSHAKEQKKINYDSKDRAWSGG
jgi:hypothetical protein